MNSTSLPQLNKYTLVRKIASGGMGIVYEATHIDMGKRVALKVVYPHFAENPQFVSRFRAEMRTVGALSHPNIVEALDGGIDSDQYYLALAYMPNGTLTERLKSPLPLSEVDRIAQAITAALACAHANGYIHRDIKPHNILFNIDDRPMLTDFGISRIKGGAEDATHLTATGVQVGTLRYMSPEQLRDPRVVDERSDLYSLGLVLYEMLVGAPPHDAKSTVGLYQERTEKPIPRLPESAAHYQPLIDRLLAADPDERHASANELLTELESLAKARAMDDATVEKPITLPDPPVAEQPNTPNATPPNRWRYGAIAAVIVVSGLAYWVLGTSHDSQANDSERQVLLDERDSVREALDTDEREFNQAVAESDNDALRAQLAQLTQQLEEQRAAHQATLREMDTESERLNAQLQSERAALADLTAEQDHQSSVRKQQLAALESELEQAITENRRKLAELSKQSEQVHSDTDQTLQAKTALRDLLAERIVESESSLETINQQTRYTQTILNALKERFLVERQDSDASLEEGQLELTQIKREIETQREDIDALKADLGERRLEFQGWLSEAKQDLLDAQNTYRAVVDQVDLDGLESAALNDLRVELGTIKTRLETMVRNAESAPGDGESSEIESENDLIETLLTEAQDQIERKKLTTPVDDNAKSTLDRVLAMDPNNDEANALLESIAETYIAWAENDIRGAASLYQTIQGKLSDAKYRDDITPLWDLWNSARSKVRKISVLHDRRSSIFPDHLGMKETTEDRIDPMLARLEVMEKTLQRAEHTLPRYRKSDPPAIKNEPSNNWCVGVDCWR